MISRIPGPVNYLVTTLKALTLKFSEQYLDEQAWNDLYNSIEDNRGNYTIYNHDIPNIRDLKAFLNMLIAIERASKKFTEKYSLMAVSLFKKIELIEDGRDFKRNKEIFMSTDGILTPYLEAAPDAFAFVMLKIIDKTEELYNLCTNANLEKAASFFIRRMTSMEHYRQNYLRIISGEQKEESETDNTRVNKSQPQDTAFSALSKKIDFLLEKLNYKEKDKKTKPSDYYEEYKDESETIKHLKRLSNAMTGIDNFLAHYDEYQSKNFVTGIVSIAGCAFDLKAIYDYLQKFDYRAIVADQTTPLLELVKAGLKKINGLLEKIACMVDQCEIETRLKSHALLGYVDLLTTQYNRIMNELNVPMIDRDRQKNTYFQARLIARGESLKKLREEVDQITEFLAFKNSAMADIPNVFIKKMQDFLQKYHGSICMDPSQLETYKKYLENAYKVETKGKKCITSSIEYLENRAGLTVHSKMMQAFERMQLYMKKQIEFILDRTDCNEKKFAGKDAMAKKKELTYRESRRKLG